jgi:hypothetical protein
VIKAAESLNLIPKEQKSMMYVSDSANHRIQVFNSDGSFDKRWGSKGVGNGQFYGLCGITVGKMGL